MSEKYTSLSSRESVRKNPKVARDDQNDEEYHVSRHKHVSMTIEYDDEEEVVRRGSSIPPTTNHGKAGNHGHAISKKTSSHGQHSKHHNNDDDGYEYSQPYGNATVDDVADDYGGQATVDDVADDYEIPRGGHANAKSKKSNHHDHSRREYDGEYGKATVTHVAPDYY